MASVAKEDAICKGREVIYLHNILRHTAEMILGMTMGGGQLEFAPVNTGVQAAKKAGHSLIKWRSCVQAASAWLDSGTSADCSHASQVVMFTPVQLEFMLRGGTVCVEIDKPSSVCKPSQGSQASKGKEAPSDQGKLEVYFTCQLEHKELRYSVSCVSDEAKMLIHCKSCWSAGVRWAGKNAPHLSSARAFAWGDRKASRLPLHSDVKGVVIKDFVNTGTKRLSPADPSLVAALLKEKKKPARTRRPRKGVEKKKKGTRSRLRRTSDVGSPRSPLPLQPRGLFSAVAANSQVAATSPQPMRVPFSPAQQMPSAVVFPTSSQQVLSEQSGGHAGPPATAVSLFGAPSPLASTSPPAFSPEQRSSGVAYPRPSQHLLPTEPEFSGSVTAPSPDLSTGSRAFVSLTQGTGVSQHWRLQQRQVEQEVLLFMNSENTPPPSMANYAMAELEALLADSAMSVDSFGAVWSNPSQEMDAPESPREQERCEDLSDLNLTPPTRVPVSRLPHTSLLTPHTSHLTPRHLGRAISDDAQGSLRHTCKRAVLEWL